MDWIDFKEQAEDVVAATKAEWPGCEGVMCGGGGGSSGAFTRTGTGLHERYHSVPDAINSLITQNAANAGTDPNLAAQQSTLFGDLMGATPQTQPGYSNLTTLAGSDPTSYDGKSTLQAVARRDPYDGAYATQTEAAYRQRAGDAMAMAESGPAAVRGGGARSGIAQSQLAERLAAGRGAEIRSAQQQDVGNVMQAAGGMAGVEGQRTGNVLQAISGLLGITDSVGNRGLAAGKQLDFNKLNNLQLLQLASTLQGSTVDKQTDNFAGSGDQSGWQGGVSCCFIFLQALNGELPWYINMARRDFYTPVRRRGYKWMSTWLVPAMKRFAWVQAAVNTVLIKPFLRYGAYIYGDKNSKRSSALYAPYCKLWLALWGGLGRVV